jgi:hypothetical protein
VLHFKLEFARCLIEIGILNIGRIFGVLELVLMGLCQPTGDLGSGIVNRSVLQEGR